MHHGNVSRLMVGCANCGASLVSGVTVGETAHQTQRAAFCLTCGAGQTVHQGRVASLGLPAWTDQHRPYMQVVSSQVAAAVDQRQREIAAGLAAA